MPQVAQQDYMKIAPKLGRGIQEDAAAKARIKQLLQRGTILDAVITTAFEENTEDSGENGRVLGFFKDQNVYVYDGFNEEIMTINTPYSERQYEGLSAVQSAIDSSFGVGAFMPILDKVNQQLVEHDDIIFICVDGYKLDINENDGILQRLSLSQDKPNPETEDFINISWEDAQKLIGLPIYQN